MATQQWQMLMKEAFLQDLDKLPPKDTHQIMAKVFMLNQNPLPDGDVKKQLIHHPGKPYRIRSGDYRILYTFEKRNVCIYRIERRNEQTYKQNLQADPVEGIDSDFDDIGTLSELPAGDARFNEAWFKPQDKSPLIPEPITVELLNKLQIPRGYHQRLMQVKTQDELYDCESLVGDIAVLKLMDYLFETPLQEAMQQPNFVLNEVDDLLRYKEGELLTFLLQLSPEQEKFAHWSLQASGPTLVKGGPGTGKSTVALYRVRSLLNQLTAKASNSKGGAPQILFTTYTNALIKSSQQLLNQLLGNNSRYVRVDTADSIAYSILNQCGRVNDFTIVQEQKELQQLMRQAIEQANFAGNLLQRQAQKQTIEKMGLDYLLQEINTVIVARQITSLDEYRQMPRNGRKLRLNAIQRAAVWQVYEQWQRILLTNKQETWQQRRVRALALVGQSNLHGHFDAVVIDEAQDLDPTALRMLIALSKSPERIFITADANQSIYGSGFSWSDVHASLRFQGRASILRANYRSTAEIGEAAFSYLTTSGLEGEAIERQYINNGPLPDARSVLNRDYETQLLLNYFRKAHRSLRLTTGACAVLCPNDSVGRTLAQALSASGMEANFMKGSELNLARPGVKIITLKSAKGLEFPIVALAGFTMSNYPNQPADATPDEIAELLAQERRTMFVGMTRAMRALLVVLPHETENPLLQGFDPALWNFSRTI